MRLKLFSLAFAILALLFVSCASNKPATAEAPATQAPADSVATPVDTMPTVNKDIAHESFLRYLYLQLREEPELSIVFLQHAAEADPVNRYLSFTLAEELAEREQYDMAMSVAERAKALPGKSNAAEDGLLASLYLRTGAADSAKHYYKKAIAENEEDYTKIYEYSLFLEWEEPKDTDELIRVYRMLLPRIHYMRNMFNRTGQLMLQSGKDTAFCALLTEAFEATGDKSFMLDKYSYYDGMKMRDSAVATLKVLHGAMPEDTTVLKLYGASLITTNSSAETSAMILEYRKEHEASPSIVYLQGLAARGENKLDSAKKYFNEIASDAEFGAQAHAQLSFVAGDLNDTTGAVNEIELADSLAPGQYFADRLRCYMKYGKHERSFAMLDTVLDSLRGQMQQEKDLPPLKSEEETQVTAKERYYAVLSVYADMHMRYATKIVYAKPDSAEIHYKIAPDAIDLYLLNDPNAVSMKFLRASILERRKKTDEAVAVFRELLKIDPKDHLVMNYLGYTFIDLARTPEEVKEGIALVDSALTYDPENASYLDSKAWGLFRNGKYKEAYDVMVLVSTKDPKVLEDVSYWEHLGRILEAMGDKEEAEECFRTLYKLSPKHPYAKE